METALPRPTVPIPVPTKRHGRARRRSAEALLYAALLLTALLTMAEPWLLVPASIATLAVAMRK